MTYEEFLSTIQLDRLKMIAVNRHRIPPESIDESAKKLYDEIQTGLSVKKIAIGQRIIANAKVLGAKAAIPTHPVDMQRKIADLTERVKQLERSWWDKFKEKHPILFKKIEVGKGELIWL